MKRKKACNAIIECLRCKKQFKTNQNLKKHINKKNKCQYQSNEIDKLKLLLKIEQEKNKSINKTDNRNKTTIKNNKTNKIINIYPTININNTFNFNIKNITSHIQTNILTLGIDKFGKIISEAINDKEQIIKIMELLYKNPKYPEYQNIVYDNNFDQFFIAKDNKWTEIKYKKIKPIIINSLQHIIQPYMTLFKENGSWNFDNIQEIQPDKNLSIHFKLKDCDNLILSHNKNKRNYNEFKETIQEGINKKN